MRVIVKDKFYNRCNRINELLATVMEQKLYNRFLEDLREQDQRSTDLMVKYSLCHWTRKSRRAPFQSNYY